MPDQWNLQQAIDDPSNRMIDLRDVVHVEVVFDEGNKLWVNVNNKCLLRIGHVDQIVVEAMGRNFKQEFT